MSPKKKTAKKLEKKDPVITLSDAEQKEIEIYTDLIESHVDAIREFVEMCEGLDEVLDYLRSDTESLLEALDATREAYLAKLE